MHFFLKTFLLICLIKTSVLYAFENKEAFYEYVNILISKVETCRFINRRADRLVSLVFF
jgi:hypothetical protein